MDGNSWNCSSASTNSNSNGPIGRNVNNFNAMQIKNLNCVTITTKLLTNEN